MLLLLLLLLLLLPFALMLFVGSHYYCFYKLLFVFSSLPIHDVSFICHFTPRLKTIIISKCFPFFACRFVVLFTASSFDPINRFIILTLVSGEWQGMLAVSIREIRGLSVREIQWITKTIATFSPLCCWFFFFVCVCFSSFRKLPIVHSVCFTIL